MILRVKQRVLGATPRVLYRVLPHLTQTAAPVVLTRPRSTRAAVDPRGFLSGATHARSVLVPCPATSGWSTPEPSRDSGPAVFRRFSSLTALFVWPFTEHHHQAGSLPLSLEACGTQITISDVPVALYIELPSVACGPPGLFVTKSLPPFLAV